MDTVERLFASMTVAGFVSFLVGLGWLMIFT